MKTDISKTSLPWQQIAYSWKTNFTVPSRISESEIGKYREWLKKFADGKKKPLKALVFGATPELRDALTDLDYSVYSMDINLDMFLAMDELLKNKNKDEVLIKSNWLSSPLQNAYFDVVVGDAVLPNIPWDDRLKLLSEVKRLLKTDGIFISRSFLAPSKKRFNNIEKIFKHFSSDITESTEQLALEMVLELQYLTYSPDDHLGSFTKARDELAKYHKTNGSHFHNARLQKIHDLVWNFWCEDFANKVFVYAYKDQEEADYEKYFQIKETFEATDHSYSDITPMYLLISK